MNGTGAHVGEALHDFLSRVNPIRLHRATQKHGRSAAAAAALPWWLLIHTFSVLSSQLKKLP